MLKGRNKKASRTIMFGAHACSIENETSWMDHGVINTSFSGFDLMRELEFKPSGPLRLALVS